MILVQNITQPPTKNPPRCLSAGANSRVHLLGVKFTKNQSSKKCVFPAEENVFFLHQCPLSSQTAIIDKELKDLLTITSANQLWKKDKTDQ